MKILLAVGGGPHSQKVLLLGKQIIECTSEAPTVLTVARRSDDQAQAEALLASAEALLADQGLMAL